MINRRCVCKLHSSGKLSVFPDAGRNTMNNVMKVISGSYRMCSR